MNKVDKNILKILLTFSAELKILKILRYNKNLQNIVDIDLNFYKNYAKKYIIYKDNKRNFGREFDNGNVLLYEGGFINGQRSGKGKEFNYL